MAHECEAVPSIPNAQSVELTDHCDDVRSNCCKQSQQKMTRTAQLGLTFQTMYRALNRISALKQSYVNYTTYQLAGDEMQPVKSC